MFSSDLVNKRSQTRVRDREREQQHGGVGQRAPRCTRVAAFHQGHQRAQVRCRRHPSHPRAHRILHQLHLHVSIYNVSSLMFYYFSLFCLLFYFLLWNR